MLWRFVIYCHRERKSGRKTAFEGFCPRYRPAAASEGQAELRGGTLRKSKAHAKDRHPWRPLSCSLQAFACRLIAALASTPPRTCPSLLGFQPPLIKDTAEPPGWLVLVRGLVELTKLKIKRSAESSYSSRF